MNRTQLQMRASEIELEMMTAMRKLLRFSTQVPVIEPALRRALNEMGNACACVRELMHPEDRA